MPHSLWLTAQGAPFGGHVGNGQAVVDRDACHGLFGAGEFDGMVQNLVLVEETAQSDDHVLTRDTWGKDTSQGDLGDRRYLPPSAAGSVDAGCICSNNRGAETGYTPVHVRMTVARDGEGSGPGVSYRCVKNRKKGPPSSARE